MPRFLEPKNARSQRSPKLIVAPLTASLSNSLLHFVLILHPLSESALDFVSDFEFS